MAVKRIAKDIELHVDQIGDEANFDKVANIMSVTDPSLERDAVNMTCLDDDIQNDAPSPVLRVGEVNLSLYWDEADDDVTGQRILEKLLVNNYEAAKFRITCNFTDTPITKTYEGFIQSLGEVNYEQGGVPVQRDCVLNITSVATRGTPA